MLQRNTLSSLHLFWEASRSPVTQLGLSNALSEGALFPPDPFSSPPLEPGLHWVNFSLFAHYKKKNKKNLFFFCWVAFNPLPPLAAVKLYRSIKGQPYYGKCSEHLFLEVPALLFAGLGDTFDTCQLPPHSVVLAFKGAKKAVMHQVVPMHIFSVCHSLQQQQNLYALLR